MKRVFGAIALACLLLAGCAAPPAATEATTPSTAAPTTEPVTEPVTEPTPAPTQPPVTKVSTATLGATGDILLHNLVIQSGRMSDGSYNYDNIFKYLSPYASRLDWAAANLEVTLSGLENGYPYQGYPCFNAPDAIVDGLKGAGFDMLLTANNHAYDTRHAGLLRTQQVILDRGLSYTGTRQTETDANFLIQEVNGIRIGMICYTYNTRQEENGTVALNGIGLTAADSKLVNSFSYSRLDSFYKKLAGELTQMKALGAQATVLFIHWGDEYNTAPNSRQKAMAQQLCNLGLDVIVGNHAHVIQPLELLTSETDEARKTLCLYSTGNAVSNIFGVRDFPVHTEDGIVFSVTFARYSDGTVLLERTDVLPTWVYRRWDDSLGRRMFEILPLPHDQSQWSGLNLPADVLARCQASYSRTMALVEPGLTQANAWYAAQQQAAEAALGIPNS